MSVKNDEFTSIKDKTGEKYNHQELHINRVPDEAAEKLKSLSYEKFAGDFGMTLAYLLELHELRSEFDDKLVNTNRKVVELEDKITAIEKMIEQEKQDDSQSKKGETLQ